MTQNFEIKDHCILSPIISYIIIDRTNFLETGVQIHPTNT